MCVVIVAGPLVVAHSLPHESMTVANRVVWVKNYARAFEDCRNSCVDHTCAVRCIAVEFSPTRSFLSVVLYFWSFKNRIIDWFSLS